MLHILTALFQKRRGRRQASGDDGHEVFSMLIVKIEVEVKKTKKRAKPKKMP